MGEDSPAEVPVQNVETEIGGDAQGAYEVLSQLQCYWANEHRRRTQCRELRRGGYALGSGGIESSNKFICHVRFKRSGAWWYEINSHQMLALRCAK